MLRRKGCCDSCSRPLDPFGRCRRKDCPAFNPLWAGDWQQVLVQNLKQLGDVILVTVTAPGTADGLVWDRSRCTHPETQRCSGPAGCRVLEAAADAWNEDCLERFSKLHRRAAARTRRATGPGPLLAAKTPEFQQRGVLHLHLVLDYRVGRPRWRADHYIAALRELAPGEMFGSVDASHVNRRDGAGGARAAFYVGKYVGKAVMETAIRRPAMVGRHLTSETRVTMRNLRRKRFWHVVCRLNNIWDDGVATYCWEADVGRTDDDLEQLLKLFRISLPPPSPALAGST